MRTPAPARWHALTPYLDQLLDLDADARVDWLASIRRQDPDLAREIADLVDEHHAVRDERFLERPAPVLPAPGPAAGSSVGAYTLVSPIGEGGMGTVWLAERNDGRFERRAAVKFLNLALASRGQARFRREGAILARLEHPNIAQLIDAGTTVDGHAFLILEFVEGERIDAYCDRRVLDVKARVRLVLGVLAAVAYAHSHLVVHRDLKPSNVLVGANGDVKLLDFGIARLLANDQTAAPPTMLTRQGGAAFTPEYAAPEQLTGEPVTTAADVYGLGVLLYVLLTGQHPVGDALGSPAALVRAITEMEPARPSDVVTAGRLPSAFLARNAALRGTSPDRLRRAMRGDLDTIICKALKKSPQERYASATAFADDLRKYLANEPIAARPDTMGYRAGKFVRRNTTAVALTMLALAATVAGTAGTIIQARTARVERDFAVHQLSRAEAINDLNRFILSDAAPSGRPFTVNDLLARAEAIIERQHGPDEATHVELLLSIGRQYAGQDEDAAARRVLTEAYRRSRGVGDSSVRARAACALGSQLSRGGDQRRAEALVREGLSEVPEDAAFAIDRAWCLLRAAEVSRQAGRSQEAIERVQTARRVLDASPMRSEILALDGLIDLAAVYRLAGEGAQAEAAFRQAWNLVVSLGRDNTQMAATVLNNWGLALQQLGRPIDAERLFSRAIAMTSGGPDEQAVSPMLLVNDARALRDLGRLAEAADYVERGYASAQRSGDNVVVSQSLLLKAAVYRMQGDLTRAAQALAEVEPRLRRSLPPGHIGFAVLKMQQAQLGAAHGDLRNAVTTMTDAISLVEASIKAGSQGRDYLPPMLVARSDFNRRLGQLAEAGADASRSVELLQRELPAASWSSIVGQSYLALGRALAAQGRSAEAGTAFQTAFDHLERTLGPAHPDTLAARQLSNRAPTKR